MADVVTEEYALILFTYF